MKTSYIKFSFFLSFAFGGNLYMGNKFSWPVPLFLLSFLIFLVLFSLSCLNLYSDSSKYWNWLVIKIDWFNMCGYLSLSLSLHIKTDWNIWVAYKNVNNLLEWKIESLYILSQETYKKFNTSLGIIRCFIED